MGGDNMKYEVIDRIADLVTVAFGLVAALAWNQAILTIFAAVLGPAVGIPALLSYAVIVTVIAVAVTIWLGRMSQRAKSATSTAEKTDKGQKAA